jgi:hypothetical protein
VEDRNTLIVKRHTNSSATPRKKNHAR